MRSSRRHVNSFNMVSCKSEYFKNSFIPNVINKWNKLDPDIRSSTSYNLFRNTLLTFIRPAQRKTFNINDSVGVKLLTRLPLGFSHLRDHKFRHGFRDILNPLCPCSIETVTTAYYKGAVGYFRCKYQSKFKCSFIMSKARLAPMNEKQLTIPRLKLQAAVLGCPVRSVIVEETKLKAMY